MRQSLEKGLSENMLLPFKLIFSLAKFLSIRVVVLIISEEWLENPANAEQLSMLMREQNLYIETPSLDYTRKKIFRSSNFCHSSQILVVDQAGAYKLNLFELPCFHGGIHWVSAEEKIYEGLSGTQLRLDSNFYTFSTTDNIITEWYSLRGNLFKGYFGEWDKGDRKLIIPIASKWSRRNNFKGISLKVGTLPFARAVIAVKSTDTTKRKVTGQVPDLLAFLIEQHNISVQWTYPEHRVFGTRLDNGTGTGLIGMMQSQQVDMVATALALTKQRAEVLIF